MYGTGASLNHLSTPLLLCGSDGRIIYKNDAAARLLTLPKCGASLLRCLDDVTRERFRLLCETGKPQLFALETSSTGFYQAVGGLLDYKERRCVALIFANYLQLRYIGMTRNIFFSEPALLYEPLADRLRALLCGAVHKASERRVVELVNGQLGEAAVETLTRLESETAGVQYSMPFVFGKLVKTASGLLKKYGGCVLTDMPERAEERLGANELIVDFAEYAEPFVLTLLQLTLLSRDRLIKISVRPGERAGRERLLTELETAFASDAAPGYERTSADFCTLAEWLPERILELTAFNTLIHGLSAEAFYTLTRAEEHGRLRVTLVGEYSTDGRCRLGAADTVLENLIMRYNDYMERCFAMLFGEAPIH